MTLGKPGDLSVLSWWVERFTHTAAWRKRSDFEQLSAEDRPSCWLSHKHSSLGPSRFGKQAGRHRSADRASRTKGSSRQQQALPRSLSWPPASAAGPPVLGWETLIVLWTSLPVPRRSRHLPHKSSPNC